MTRIFPASSRRLIERRTVRSERFRAATIASRVTPGFPASGAVGGGPAKSDLTGYSILQADSLDAAVQLAGGCPIIADGGTVDVYEAIDVGG